MSDRDPHAQPPAEPRSPSGGRPPSEQRPGRGTSPSWPWAVAFVLAVAMVVLAGLYVFRSLRDLPGDAVDRGAEILGRVGEVARAFQQGTVETRFLSHATRVSGGTRLQFATLEQTEIFHRTDRTSILWGQLPLPEVMVEAIAPVTYTYYVDLQGPWELELEDHRVLARVPPIEFNEPAIDASEIRYETRSTSLLRDEEAVVAALKAGLTEMARVRAKESVPLVREVGRARIEDFVENWLMETYGDGGTYRVQVVFADEETPRMPWWREPSSLEVPVPRLERPAGEGAAGGEGPGDRPGG